MKSHLQQFQVYAAGEILCLTKSSSITTHLESLNWLPVKVRSTYQIAFCATTAKAVLHYIICRCHAAKKAITHPQRFLQLIHQLLTPLLNRPAHSKATLGDRSFSFASSVWNSIPNDIWCAPSLSSFKSRLNTYLFRSVYKH